MGCGKHGTLFHPEMQKLPSCIFLIFFVIINLTRKMIQIKQSLNPFLCVKVLINCPESGTLLFWAVAIELNRFEN